MDEVSISWESTFDLLIKMGEKVEQNEGEPILQGDRDPKDTGCFDPGYRGHAVQGFHAVGAGCQPHRLAHGMVCHAPLAAELCLPDIDPLVELSGCRVDRPGDRLGHREPADLRGGPLQSGGCPALRMIRSGTLMDLWSGHGYFFIINVITFIFG